MACSTNYDFCWRVLDPRGVVWQVDGECNWIDCLGTLPEQLAKARAGSKSDMTPFTMDNVCFGAAVWDSLQGKWS